MTTLHGAPLPEDFENNAPLPADAFNAVKNYWVTDELPDTAEDGDVVFVVESDPFDPNATPGLPGLDGWATLDEVSGRFTRHNDGDWVAYEFTDNGTIKTSGGIVDALLVGGGSYRTSVPRFCGGRVNEGLLLIGESHTITVGKGQRTQSATWGSGSAISGVVEQGPVPYPATGGFVGAGPSTTVNNGGIPSSITGSEVIYAAHSLGTPGGSTATNASVGLDGVVVIRVPKEYADNVTENYFRWLNFATVENGVVTSVNKTPDNIPYTTAVDEIPCGPEVAEGWNYDGSEFVAPEPDYSEQIKELEETLKNLRSAK